MRRSEAVVSLSAAALMLVSGLVWLFGPFGLIGAGFVIAVLVLFVVDVKG